VNSAVVVLELQEGPEVSYLLVLVSERTGLETGREERHHGKQITLIYILFACSGRYNHGQRDAHSSFAASVLQLSIIRVRCPIARPTVPHWAATSVRM
jgi:hypothetical protein